MAALIAMVYYALNYVKLKIEHKKEYKKHNRTLYSVNFDNKKILERVQSIMQLMKIRLNCLDMRAPRSSSVQIEVQKEDTEAAASASSPTSSGTSQLIAKYGFITEASANSTSVSSKEEAGKTATPDTKATPSSPHLQETSRLKFA